MSSSTYETTPKEEQEFHPVTDVAYTPCEGNVPGLKERILATTGRPGVVSRMLRLEPGTDTSPNGTLSHDFWEEVYIVEGSMTDLRLDQTFVAGTFACRPPGMEHGPWISENGCTTFEVRYEDTGSAGPGGQPAREDGSTS